MKIAAEKALKATSYAKYFAHTKLIVFETRSDFLNCCFEGDDSTTSVVEYDIPDKGIVREAEVVRCKNGVSVNYPDPYMRRRDPSAMVIADKLPTNKQRYEDRFGSSFEPLRKETLTWLSKQEALILVPFWAGGNACNDYPTLLICPVNAVFFALALADLQGFIPASSIPDSFDPIATLFVAPPFRHTHFSGKQVVVHNRQKNHHEVFSYNLYPGPSAKKGVYGILLNIGEKEGWTTLHSSAVRMITPYDNEFVILHEGASGGGKSEMTQPIHRTEDGKVLLGESIVTDINYYLDLKDTCELHPVTDDMSLAHPSIQQSPSRRLVIRDAEEGWFLRVDHMQEYGAEPQLERLCIRPPEPLIFLNIDASPGSTALLWDHIEDEPGKRCSNPRVILPRRFAQNITNEAVSVHVRSFGVRTPPSTEKEPNYGIIGLMHVLPPSLAWLWRLAAPRGHANPSIVGKEGLQSEGVGSFWPFATGEQITHANILLRQIQETPGTRYVLIPNQYIGSYHVGFSPEWIAREFLARHGSARFKAEKLKPSRCPLLGYTLSSLKVNGQDIPQLLLSVEKQMSLGIEGYDKGAKILTDFFKSELQQFHTPKLHPLGRAIIDLCLNNASLDDYTEVLPMHDL